MGHRSGWWGVWNYMRRVSCRSRARGDESISSRINNFSLHVLSEGTTCVIAAVKKPIGSAWGYRTPLFESLV